MPLVMETSTEADLLFVEELEIEPLPDGLIAAEAAGTSDFAGCCSCEMCSSLPEPEQPCWFWSLG